MMSRGSRLITVLLLCTAVFTHAAEPQKSDAEKKVTVPQALRLFQEWADAFFAYDRIPGASVGLVSDQKLVWSRGFGYADQEKKVPPTAETLYGICSISKLFTAVAVMQQRDAGKLHLDDPVSQYLPYVNLEAADKDSLPPTVGSLLMHSSGLPRESAQPYWTEPDFAFPTKDQIIQGLISQKMLYSPDQFFQYSNLGFTLAGEVVEKVSGKDYNDYVQQEILKPLHLAHTTPYLPENERGKLLATGYGSLTRDGNREVMPFYNTRGITHAAGYASNVIDLGAFASWQFRLLDKGGTEVLKASTLREMQRVHWVDPDWKTTWGLGFVVWQQDDQTYVGHTGHCPGYFTSIMEIPRKKLAAVVLTNAMNVTPEKVARQLLKIVGPPLEEEQKSQEEAKTSQEQGKTEKKPAPDFDRFTGLYRNAWGETIIVPWKDGLAALDVPSDNPMDDLTELKHVEKETFRRVRKDSDDLGEEITFQIDADGKVKSLLWFENYSFKIR